MTDVLTLINERIPGAVAQTHAHRGDQTAVITREHIIEVLTLLRDAPELEFNVLIDLTGVDYLTYPGREPKPRFEVVYHLLSLQHLTRIRLKVQVAESDCWLPSACALYANANWLEREAWDMFGIEFRGHPNLTRLLMYEEFKGHPLRKDYPYNLEQPLIEPRPGWASMTGADRGTSIRPRSLEVHGRPADV